MEKVYGDLFQMLTVRILEIHDTPIKDISDNTFNGVIANGLKVSQDKAYMAYLKLGLKSSINISH